GKSCRIAKKENGRRALLLLRQIVPNTREVVRELVLEKDHGDDDRDGDDSDDECVFDHSLSSLVEPKTHSYSLARPGGRPERVAYVRPGCQPNRGPVTGLRPRSDQRRAVRRSRAPQY